MQGCEASTDPWIVVNTNPHRERLVSVGGCARPGLPSWRWRGAAAAIGGLVAIAPFAWAQSDCQSAFERWTKLSDRGVVRVSGQVAGGRGACIPSEAARDELLAALSRTRALCAASDQGAQRTLLDINKTFISSLVVCQSDTADAAASLSTKPEPTPEDGPKVAAPPPPPPPPRPKVVVVAPPATAPPTPPCLEISAGKAEQFALVNRRCRGHTVLAVIETRGAGGETVCKGYSIVQRLSVRTAGSAPPRINHECVLSQGPCNKGRLEGMFPECDW